MTNPLVFPDRFFRDRRPADVSRPTLIVLAAALTNVAGAVILAWLSWDTIVSAGPAVTTTYVVSILFGFGMIFATWLLYGAAFYLLSEVLGGEGTFRSVVIYAGWGFIPTALAGLVRALAIGYVVWGARFPNDPAQLGPFVERLTSAPLFTGVEYLDIAFTLWSGIIWLFAVKYARDLSTWEAVICVAVPVSVGLLLSV